MDFDRCRDEDVSAYLKGLNMVECGKCGGKEWRKVELPPGAPGEIKQCSGCGELMATVEGTAAEPQEEIFKRAYFGLVRWLMARNNETA